MTYHIMSVGVILLCLLIDDLLLDLQPLLALFILCLKFLNQFVFLFELGLFKCSLSSQPCINCLVVDVSEFLDLIPELVILQSHAVVLI